MFLPDRYVRGTCPNCGTRRPVRRQLRELRRDLSPTDLKKPRRCVCGTTPVLRDSEHLFFKLGDFEPCCASGWPASGLQPAVRAKLDEWLEAGLQDWDISRDAPYFGFEIPDAPGKYFYVWLDAPIGYLASFEALCARSAAWTSTRYWKPDSDDRAVPLHRQGHHLLPRAVLAGDAARRRLAPPDRRARARLPDRQRREDVQVARHLHHGAPLPRAAAARAAALLLRRQARRAASTTSTSTSTISWRA